VQTLHRGGGERVAVLSAHGTTHGAAMLAIRAALPARFDPEQARDLEATLELRVRKPGGGSTPLALRIAHGELQVSPGPATDAGAGAELGADDLVRLVAGVVGWPALVSAGRMSLTGDPFLALRFPALFRLPAG
jgi:hypothetical protein